LKDLTGKEHDPIEFVGRLARNLMANVRLAESEGGAKRIIDKIDFEY
jgi:hypothetical protein